MSGRSFKLHKTCQSGVLTNKILLLFGTIFRHVVLLITEISYQDQNFAIIPHIICLSQIPKNCLFALLGVQKLK